MSILNVAMKNNERCVEWTSNMPSQKIIELVPGVSDADVLDDTGANSIELDPEKNPNAT